MRKLSERGERNERHVLSPLLPPVLLGLGLFFLSLNPCEDQHHCDLRATAAVGKHGGKHIEEKHGKKKRTLLEQRQCGELIPFCA